MYTQFFQLRQAPFSIAPDPRYLFMSERHREALAHLLYGVDSGGGFVLLTGEIGAGKTTVCRCFLEQVPANCNLAYVFNPKLTVAELLQTVCGEFHIDAPAGASVKTYVDAINSFLLASHAARRNNVLIIDEAQNLAADVLEQLRLLTNLETSERKLLQIILIGQPELRTMLARPELEQMAQRVIARYHLGPLTEAETAAYIQHRMAVAGAHGAGAFPPAVTRLVYRLSGGVPRRINLLCDRALLGAYVENRSAVTRAIVRRAAEEVFGGAGTRTWPRWAFGAAGVLTAAALAAAAVWQGRAPAPAPAPARPVVAKAPIQVVADAPPTPFMFDDERSALRESGSLWNSGLVGDDPCAAAKQDDLRCYHGKGGVYELRQLDRPAVLSLRDGGRVQYVFLAGLDGTRAILQAQGKRQSVDLGWLAARMDGEFTTLWRIPAAYRDELKPGDRGADVDWLADQLAREAGAEAPAAGQAFDLRTQDLLRTFQAQQNLKADGLAGPRTFMRLNQLLAVAEPRLQAAPHGK
ncbi:MAG TPA: AAA family ATPase [Telluria sp.]|nr:AAA family ATPase [Telluria sp.]